MDGTFSQYALGQRRHIPRSFRIWSSPCRFVCLFVTCAGSHPVVPQRSAQPQILFASPPAPKPTFEGAVCRQFASRSPQMNRREGGVAIMSKSQATAGPGAGCRRREIDR
jgi:hypothetical protein